MMIIGAIMAVIGFIVESFTEDSENYFGAVLISIGIPLIFIGALING